MLQRTPPPPLVGTGTYNLMVTITDASGNTVTAPLTVVTRQYVVRYPADESSGAVLDDTSGGNNTASLTGSYSFVAGRTGNAVKLTGGYAKRPRGGGQHAERFHHLNLGED